MEHFITSRNSESNVKMKQESTFATPRVPASVQLPMLQIKTVEREIASFHGLDSLTTRRLYLRPFGRAFKFKAQLRDHGTVTAELNGDDQLVLRMDGIDPTEWRPIVLFEACGNVSSELAVPWTQFDWSSNGRSFTLAADGGNSSKVDLTGKIDAGFIYELVADRNSTEIDAAVYSSLKNDLPAAIELRILCKTDSQWNFHSEILQLPSHQVIQSSLSELDLTKRLRRLWMMLKERTREVHALKCIFQRPNSVQSEDRLSLIVYPKKIAERLPVPGRCFLIENVGSEDHITTRKFGHAQEIRSGDRGALGFFVTFARRKRLTEDVGTLSKRLHPKRFLKDFDAVEDVRQTYASKATDEINKGAPNSLLTDDAQKKLEYSQIMMNNVCHDYVEKSRRQTEFLADPKVQGLTRDDDARTSGDCPVERLINLETYERALELLESMATAHQVKAILAAVSLNSSWSEAANEYGIPAVTLRTIVHRFRKAWLRLHGAFSVE